MNQNDHCRPDDFDIMAAKKRVKSKDMEKLSSYIDYLRCNPKLTYLFIELTDSCNLSCLHCGSNCGQRHHDFIDTDLIIESLRTIAADFRPESVMICLTGGEPMLHRDFYKIVMNIVQLGFPWGITTNGTLIDRRNAKLLKHYGLQSITLSIDGLEKTHDWLRNSPGSFQKTLSAVGELQAVDIPVQITSVIHRKNFYELDSIYQLVCQLHVCSWRVINVDPIGRAMQNMDLLLSRKEILELFEFIRKKRYSKDTPMDIRYGCSHYLSYEYEHELRDNYYICGSGIYVGSILCNGDIYSCLDIERRPELVQGNISRDRFSAVWYDKFEEFRENRADKSPLCCNCPEKRFCGGDSTHTWDFDRKIPRFCILRKEKIYE